MSSGASEDFQSDLAPVVRVMLMKVVAPFSDTGSTPVSSTKSAGVKDSLASIRPDGDLLIGSCTFDGAAPVSTGSVVATGDIRKLTSVKAKTIIVKPMTMAAAA